MQNLNLNLLIKKANYHRPLIFNAVLWSLAFVILVFVFSKGKLPITVDYIYTITFLIVMAIPVLINFYVLLPKFLKHEKYVRYSVYFSINLITFAMLGSWLFQPILDVLFPNYFFISYLSKTNILFVFTIFLIATTLLKLAEDWFYFNTNENKMLRLKNLHIETQLSALRAQINPHFLFNSLNVIYALALEKKEGVTDAIVQLSDILRYVIYDSNSERVALKDELILLQNYIAFQNYRVELPNATSFNSTIENETFKIYPMLLLPLLENSYKHGIIAGKMQKPIEVDVFQTKNKFRFSIKNEILNTKNTIANQHAGVGLENLKNNLNLVYPNQHSFNIETTKTSFKVTLIITDEA